MIRTKILPCYLHRNQADELNHASGQIYTGVLVAHWRVVRKHDLWLSEKATTRWSDYRTSAPLHSHSIDAAQQGFVKACKTARALKKLDSTTRYPYHPKRYRTTVWKNTAIRRQKDKLLLSNGAGRPGIEIVIPESLCGVLRFLEVRLVYDKTACRYNWHIVVENGKQLKVASDSNIVSVIWVRFTRQSLEMVIQPRLSLVTNVVTNNKGTPSDIVSWLRHLLARRKARDVIGSCCVPRRA